MAVTNSDFEIVLKIARELIAAGANPKVKNDKGKTALDLSRHVTITSYLASVM